MRRRRAIEAVLLFAAALAVPCGLGVWVAGAMVSSRWELGRALLGGWPSVLAMTVATILVLRSAFAGAAALRRRAAPRASEEDATTATACAPQGRAMARLAGGALVALAFPYVYFGLWRVEAYASYAARIVGPNTISETPLEVLSFYLRWGLPQAVALGVPIALLLFGTHRAGQLLARDDARGVKWTRAMGRILLGAGAIGTATPFVLLSHPFPPAVIAWAAEFFAAGDQAWPLMALLHVGALVGMGAGLLLLAIARIAEVRSAAGRGREEGAESAFVRVSVGAAAPGSTTQTMRVEEYAVADEPEPEVLGEPALKRRARRTAR